MPNHQQSVKNRDAAHANRAEWISYIIETRFEGVKENFAREVGYEIVTVNHFLNPYSSRRCGHKAARAIESALNLKRNSIDEERQDNKEIYYIGISTNAQYTYETVMQLQQEKCVLECAAVLGEFDILIKIEVEDFKFLDTLLAKLVKLPGVQKSQTLKAIDSLRWQREQKEQMKIPIKTDRLYIHNGIDSFIHKKMNYLYDEVKLLELDPIIIRDDDPSSIEPYELLFGVKKSIYATRSYDSKLKGFRDFIKKEKDAIESGAKSFRIITLDESGYWKKDGWSQVTKQYEIYNNIGCNVKFVLENKWHSSKHRIDIGNFLILDESLVCIRDRLTPKQEEREGGRITVYRKPEIIKTYQDAFDTNWKKAYTYNQLYSNFF